MEERLTLWAVRLVERARGIREDEGQALVEYALILALIAVVSIGVLTVLGQNVSTILDSIGTAIGNAT
jgi:pilus assembly protein Flp/PilA